MQHPSASGGSGQYPTRPLLASVVRAGPLGRNKIPGSTLGPYLVERELGRGGMGMVVQALHPSGTRVALKVLLSGDAATARELRRFQREGQLGAGLARSSDGVVGVLDVGEADGLAYIAFEYVEGGTLDDLVGEVDVEGFLDLFAQIVETLSKAHAQGVIHRDLKPENIMVRAADQRALLADLGLAKDLNLSSSLTKTGAALGTPAYMAPEQIKGKPLGPSADVFALGAILYRGLTGEPPWVAANIALRYAAILSGPPDPPSAHNDEVGPALDALCLRCLAAKPEERYADAGALLVDLRALRAGTLQAPRGRGLVVGVAAVVTACVALMAWAGAKLALRPDPVDVTTDAPPTTANRRPATREEVDALFLPVTRLRGPKRLDAARAFLEEWPGHPVALDEVERLTPWRRIPPEGTWPPALGGAACAYDSEADALLLFGGVSGWAKPLSGQNELFSYDLAKGEWSQPPLGSALGRPQPRFACASTFDSDRSALVIVSGVQRGTGLLDHWDYQRDGGWKLRVTRKVSLDGAALAYDPKRKVLVLFGGRFTSGSRKFSGELWEWDGKRWTERPYAKPWPGGRFQHELTWDPHSQRVLLHGGSSNKPKDDLWAWDGEEWTKLEQSASPRPKPRLSHSFLALEDGRAFLFGGVSKLGAEPYKDTWIFDRGTWTRMAPLTSPTAGRSAAAIYDPKRRRVLLYGGSERRKGRLTPSDALWEYPVPPRRTVAEWTPSPRSSIVPPPAEETARDAEAMALRRMSDSVPRLERARALLAKHPDQPDAKSIEARLRPWTQAEPGGEAPTPRTGTMSNLAYDPVGKRSLVFGGWDRKDYFSDLWAWDGSWKRLHGPRKKGGPTQPSARLGAAGAVDLARRHYLLFGGQRRDRSFDDTLWVLDLESLTWSERASAPGQAWPRSRAWARLVYDPKREVSVLLGGANHEHGRAEPIAWEWNGQSWAGHKRPGAPKEPAAACFDPRLGEVLVFATDGSLRSWDGIRWEAVSVEGQAPGPRIRSHLVASGEGLFLHGGREGEGKARYDDTWRFADGRWSRLRPRGKPPKLDYFGMTYDAARGRIVVFGGESKGHRNEVWEYSSPATAAD